MGADNPAENTSNASKYFSPKCLPKPKSLRFLKKSSLWVSVVRDSEQAILLSTLQYQMQFYFFPVSIPKLFSTFQMTLASLLLSQYQSTPSVSWECLYPFSCMAFKIKLEIVFMLKVSKLQKQIFLFSFEPKNKRNCFLNSALASKMSQIKKVKVLYYLYQLGGI